MRMGWRSKFVFLLIVYCAGFATAVYCLAPAPDTGSRKSRRKGLAHSALKSDAFAKSVNSGIHKCIDFGKDAARQAAERIREKIDEAQARQRK